LLGARLTRDVRVLFLVINPVAIHFLREASVFVPVHKTTKTFLRLQ